MTYLLAGSLMVMVLLLAACTVITLRFEPGTSGQDPPAVSIQTSNSNSVLSAQNIAKDDQAGRGDLTATSGDSPQSATAVPTVTAPLPVP